MLSEIGELVLSFTNMLIKPFISINLCIAWTLWFLTNLCGDKKDKKYKKYKK